MDGRYLDCNEAYARMHGYSSREEALASNVVSVYLQPSDRMEALARIRKLKTITNLEVQQRPQGWQFHLGFVERHPATGSPRQRIH